MIIIIMIIMIMIIIIIIIIIIINYLHWCATNIGAKYRSNPINLNSLNSFVGKE